MIETKAATYQPTPQGRQMLRMVPQERMGGSMPVWETKPSPSASAIERTLEQAQNNQNPGFKSLLAYQQPSATPPHEAKNTEFGFGDIIDMANPLHHIPLLGQAYRAFTGDEIKPIGKIIGGALYGGIAGAAINLVGAVIEEETGKSLTGNAYAMLTRGEAPTLKKSAPPSKDPETALSKAQNISQNQPAQDLPAALLAFTPTAYSTQPHTPIKYAHADNARYNS